MAYDPATNMVYASNPAGGVAIVDAATNKLVTIVPLKGHINGVDFNSQYVFVADQNDNTFDVIQKGTWKVVASEATTSVDKTATTPDSVVYDPGHNQVFVSIDDNNTVQVYNASAPFSLKSVINLNNQVPNSSIGNVGPDLASVAPSLNTFYESDGNWLLSFNTATLAPTGKIDTGLILKGPNGKLVTHAGLKGSAYLDGKVFVAGDGAQSPRIYVANPNLTGSLSSIAVPSNPDALAPDPNNNIIYGFAAGLAGKGGFIMIDAKTQQYVGDVVTGGGAHTGAVNPGNGDVYVLANGSQSDPHPALLVYAPAASPVPKATIPVTGVPTWPIYAGGALLALGGAAIWANRRLTLSPRR